MGAWRLIGPTDQWKILENPGVEPYMSAHLACDAGAFTTMERR